MLCKLSDRAVLLGDHRRAHQPLEAYDAVALVAVQVLRKRRNDRLAVVGRGHRLQRPERNPRERDDVGHLDRLRVALLPFHALADVRRQRLLQIIEVAALVRLRLDLELDVVVASRADVEEGGLEFLRHDLILGVGRNDELHRDQEVQIGAVTLAHLRAELIDRLSLLMPQSAEVVPDLDLPDRGVGHTRLGKDVEADRECVVAAVEDAFDLALLEVHADAVAVEAPVARRTQEDALGLEGEVVRGVLDRLPDRGRDLSDL
ncbi:hypothetical protein [Microbacterium elymi]|uniref:Uncharacterized protein n=1 Tax=Microbacterium elymi TaxID=2909587 RepID=A0ABY5NMQ9_9MICO|nr:hypothetical protein [Microbacterium elymi]UUT36404.1 hypothetical protein L2X98_26120 [Microbacterium elymi]